MENNSNSFANKKSTYGNGEKVTFTKLDKKEYVKKAEQVILGLKKRNDNKPEITTTQIRNILTLMNELYNSIRFETKSVLSDEIQSHTQYVKMRIAYLAGRNNNVKEFINKSSIINYLDDVQDSKDKLLLTCKYMEALTAYHKYYRGEQD